MVTAYQKPHNLKRDRLLSKQHMRSKSALTNRNMQTRGEKDATNRASETNEKNKSTNPRHS